MKGIEEIKRKDGKVSYRAHYTSNKILYRKTFRREPDAIEWLEKQRQVHPNRLIKENEKFSDISFSGLYNQRGNKLYMAFDSEINAYRLLTSTQINNKRSVVGGGTIFKTRYGTYQLRITNGNKKYHAGTFKSKEKAIKKRKEFLHQIALGKPIQIKIQNSTGYKHISERKNKPKKYRFRFEGNGLKVDKYFYTLQEALDFREKYFKEKGLEMPKDYIELNFN